MEEEGRPQLRIRHSRVEDQGMEDDLAGTNLAERLKMMWRLTLDAGAFEREPVVEPRLPRQMVRVVRREG